jgi:FkbM family methyltransferase
MKQSGDSTKEIDTMSDNRSAYFSQMGEDRYLDTEIFHGMSNGVFIDIGAHDGKTFSNTYFFEKYRNWTGICIEPLPEMFEKLKAHRESVNINACVGSNEGSQPFLKVSGIDNAEMFSGLVSSIDKRQMENIQKEVKRRKGKIETVQVQTIPLAKILKQQNITHIDYCSIDTEGNELDVLRSIDFTAVDITCFSVEDLFGNSALRTFMEEKGYTLAEELDKDLIYIKNQPQVRPSKKRRSSGKSSISVVIHTKNESKNIAACIESVHGLANEIIVADMKSGDDTVSIAKKMGATILSVPDYGFADPARNTALKKATKDWILVLDADERITPALSKTIQTILREDDYDVVSFPRKNIMLGKWIEHGLRWPDYQTRLFRNGFAHWTETIHVAPQFTGRRYTLPATEKNAILHHHSDTIQYLMDKTYLQASLERYYDQQKRVDLAQIHHRMEMEFPWRFFEHEGYKDGLHGLVVNKFMQVYRFLELALYWERTGYKDVGSVQELQELWDTEAQLKSVRDELKIIKDSKFFVFWKLYSRIKEILGRRNHA